MIETKISKYYDHNFLSVDFKFNGVEFANVNVESNVLKIDIYTNPETISLDLNQFMAALQYAKTELCNTYPDIS